MHHCLLAIILLGLSISTFAQSSYTPHRVYDTKHKRFTDFEAMAAELAKADVVFFGEQHDDTATHRLEIALLEGIARRRPNVIVALEMFERDTQKLIDDYLSNKITEAEFLKDSRPWKNYQPDYKPLIEFAKAKGWKVVAGNIPRRLASTVFKGGLETVGKLPETDRKFVADKFSCPSDDYFKRFTESMSEHPGDNSPKMDPAMLDKMYQAQCIKDETMAESIAAAAQAAPNSLVIHYNGAFHSDFQLGTAARAKQRLAKSSVKVVSAMPVENLDSVSPDKDRKRGDYLIFTLKPAANTSTK